jgi:tRNA pseudouridine55 synthase
VIVHSFDLIDYAPPLARFNVHCGAGTYVRSLVHDLGQTLGCGAHLAGLRRLAVGTYGVDKALPLEEIERLAGEGNFERFLVPLKPTSEYPRAIIFEEDMTSQKGRPLRMRPSSRSFQPFRIASAKAPSHRLFGPEGRLPALAKSLEDKRPSPPRH